jgi:hypothetical protein
MADADRELRAAQNQMLFRSRNEQMIELGEAVSGPPVELDFVCECADEGCMDRIRLSALQFLAVESDKNQFIVVRGHEMPEVEDVIAERENFLIVSARGAGAEFVHQSSV